MKLKSFVFPFALLALSAPLATLHAADITWDAGGGVDTLWTNGNNWDGANKVPTNADSAVIGGTGNVDATGMATVDAMRLTRAVAISNGTITMDAITNGAGSGIFQIDTGSYATTIGSNLSFTGSTTTGNVSTFRLHNTYTGTTTINGTVTTGNIGASGSAFIDISGAAGTTGTIIFNNSINYTRTTGNTDFNLQRGTIELNAANTWSLGGASFRLNGASSTGTGTLKLGHSTALGVSTNGLFMGTTDNTIGSSTYVLQTLQTGANSVANNVTIRNSALTTVLGADIASGTATYGGNLTLNNVTTGGTAGAINLKSVQAGGTVDFTGVIAAGNTGQAVVRDLTIGDATTGLGTVRFSNASNSYTGNTIISAGTLQLGANNVLPDGSGKGSLSFNPASGTATLDMNGKTEAINGLSSSGAGSSVVDNSAGTGSLTVGTNNDTSSFGGVIKNTAGTLGLTKVGLGTLTLTGANSYSGNTTVSGGTLAVSGAGTLGASSNRLTIGGATLDLGSTTQLANNVLVTAASTFSTGTLSLGATTNAAGNGIFQINTGSYSNTIGSNLTFSGSTTSGTVSVFRLNTGYSGTTTVNGAVTVTNNIGASGSSFMDISGGTDTTGTIKFNNSITSTRTSGDTSFNLNRGTMELNAANTWNLGGGVLRLDPQVSTGTGTLKLGHATALGVSTNTLSLGNTDATIVSRTNVLQVLQTGSNTVANDMTIRNAALTTVLGADIASGTATYSGTITLNNATTGGTAGAINLKSVQAGGTVDFTGGIANGNTGQAVVRNLIIGDATTGLGTVKFSNANTYTGTTTVNAGTLLVNNTTGSGTGTNTVSVSSGATLGGSGIISGGTTVTTGTLAPGSAAATAGTLTFGAGLALNSTSIFEWDMQQALTTDPGTAPAAGGTNQGVYDKVVLNGAANSLAGSGAVFKIVLGSGKTFGDAFWDTNKTWDNVFTGTGVATSLASIFSTFNANGTNLSGGLVAGEGTFTFNGSSTVNWTAVPEPTSALAGLLIAAGLLRRRRSA